LAPGSSDRERLNTAQKVWIKQRNQCSDSECLVDLYNFRIAALLANDGPPASPDSFDADYFWAGTLNVFSWTSCDSLEELERHRRITKVGEDTTRCFSDIPTRN